MSVKVMRQSSRYYGILGAALTTFAIGNAFAISENDEEVTRLDLQGQIDTEAPFSKTLWAGAHNGYAAENWGDGDYSLQINQQYRPKHLFDFGIRLTEYDVYPASGLSSNPELCHLGWEEDTECFSTFGLIAGTNDYASFGDGLDEIEEFISQNMDEVILLKLEVYDANNHNNFRNKVGEKIESRLGDMVFKPTDWGYTEDDCPSLPVQHVTKRDVLAAGRNVVIFTQVPRKYPHHTGDEDLCDYHDESNTNKFRRNVWIGLDEMDYQGNLTSNQPLAQNNSLNTPDADGNANATTHYHNNNMSVALDAATSVLSWFDWLTDTTTDIGIKGHEVQDEAKSGHNLLELALVEYDGNNDTPDIEDFVWSWEPGYPNQDPGNGTEYKCGYHANTNTIKNYICDNNKQYACVNANREWVVTTDRGHWDDGYATCAALGDYTFGMPYNALEAEALLQAKKAVGAEDENIYVNYYRSYEDFWVASAESKPGYNFSKETMHGGSGGDPFDTIDLVNRKLLLEAGSGGLNLKSLQIRSGSRIDGFKVCYEVIQGVGHYNVGREDICRTFGGSGGSWGNELVLDTAAGEKLRKVTYYIDEKSGDDRVFYLKFETTKGNSISGGTASGTKKAYTASSRQVIGFHGRAGSELDALGLYRITSSRAPKTQLYATDWLDRDGPSGSGDYESLSGHISKGNIASACASSNMVGFAARRKSTKADYTLTGLVTTDSDNTDGFNCINADNEGSCYDFEVKYFFDSDCL